MSKSNTERIERSDIENKVREIQSQLDDAANASAPVGIGLGAVVVGGLLAGVYALGQRKAKKQTTIVEVRRA